jgi:2-oxoglutarate dehydrogenase complex dehydrogenase (E1) component-like enzyme
MDKYSFLNAAHTAYFADLYEQYQKNPDSVEGKRRSTPGDDEAPPIPGQNDPGRVWLLPFLFDQT